MKFKCLKAVYSYYFPEVRRLMLESQESIDEKLYRLSTPISELSQVSNLYTPALPLTEVEGRIDLDLLHAPIIERVTKCYQKYLTGLGSFSYCYPTAGSSEGLFHVLARSATKGMKSIYVLRGEYEGFSAYASHLGITTIEVDLDLENPVDRTPGVWFISSPSARNGNLLPDDLIQKLCQAGHELVLDVAYLGLTAPFTFDVSHPNILALVVSLSKPFGLFRFRIGYLYTRTEVASLYANRWFKDIGRHLQGLYVLESLGLETLFKQYRSAQLALVEALSRAYQLPLRASDVLLLAYLPAGECPEKDRLLYREFLRHQNYRFCLSPYYEDLEKVTEVYSAAPVPAHLSR